MWPLQQLDILKKKLKKQEKLQLKKNNNFLFIIAEAISWLLNTLYKKRHRFLNSVVME